MKTRHDGEDTTVHSDARQYSPIQGRWLTPDPAGLAAVEPSNPQTWNRYAYVMNNPVSNVDPLGLFIVDCTWEDCYGGMTGGGGGGYLDGAPQSVISSLGGNGQAPCPTVSATASPAVVITSSSWLPLGEPPAT